MCGLFHVETLLVVQQCCHEAFVVSAGQADQLPFWHRILCFSALCLL